jgi:hypothetical protein
MAVSALRDDNGCARTIGRVGALKSAAVVAVMALLSLSGCAGVRPVEKAQLHDTSPAKPVISQEPTLQSIQELLGVLRFQDSCSGIVERADIAWGADLNEAFARGHWNEAQTKIIAKFRSEGMNLIAEAFGWSNMEPIMVAGLRAVYSQQDIDALLAFYKSDGGRAVIQKIPNVIAVLTPEHLNAWEAIRQSAGEDAARDAMNRDLDVQFETLESDAFLTFFRSDMGKSIAAKGQSSEFDTQIDRRSAAYQARLDAMIVQTQAELRAASTKR